MTSEQADIIIGLLRAIDEKLNLALGLQPVPDERTGDEIISAMNHEKKFAHTHEGQ